MTLVKEEEGLMISRARDEQRAGLMISRAGDEQRAGLMISRAGDEQRAGQGGVQLPRFLQEDGERETGILGWGRGGKASTDEAPIAQLKSSRPSPGLQSRKPQLLHSEQGYNNHLE